jgi:hypothetical protein
VDKRATIRLDVETAKGRRELKGLTKDLDKTDKSTKKSAQSTSRLNKSFNGLSGGLRSTAQGLSIVQGPLGPLAGRVSAAATALNTMQAGMMRVVASSKALRIALISTGIGAIVVALGTLIAAFRSTQEGSDRLARLMRPLSAVFQAFWGVIQDVSLALADGFIPIIKSSFSAIKNLAKAGIATLTLDFQGAKDATNDFNSDMADLGAISKDVREALQGVNFDIRQTASDAMETGAEIQRLNEAIRALRIEQQVPLARLRTQYEELRNIGRDLAVDEETRLEALDKAVGIRREIQAEEIKLLDLQIQRLELQQTLNDTSDEELLQLEKLRAQREQANASAERELGRIFARRSRLVQNARDEELQAIADRLQAEKDSALELAEFEAAMIEQELLREEARVGSIAALEQKLQTQRQIFINATSELERELAAGRIADLEEIIKKMEEEAGLTDTLTDKKKELSATDIERAKTVEEFGDAVARQLVDQILLEALRSVFASLPFPANIIAAGGAIAGARALIGQVVPGFADGVTNFEGGTALVGERGPELVNLPRGSNVVTNENTESLLRDSGSSIQQALENVEWSAKGKFEEGELVFYLRKELRKESQLGGQGSL